MSEYFKVLGMLILVNNFKRSVDRRVGGPQDRLDKMTKEKIQLDNAPSPPTHSALFSKPLIFFFVKFVKLTHVLPSTTKNFIIIKLDLTDGITYVLFNIL
jgi:hypothetical protein